MQDRQQQLPWYRQAWVLVIIGLPLCVIIASSVIAGYMIKNPFPMVNSENDYKSGNDDKKS